KSVIGVDVAKIELVTYQADSDLLALIPNEKPAIKRWLKTLPRPAALAVEATNIYHVDLVELAYQAGFDVYIIDGFQLSNYRKGVGGRSKTDASDARLLARFLKNESECLRPWTPPPAVYGKLQSLLRRRASLIQAKTSLTQSWANDASLKASFAAFLKSIERLDLLVKKKLKDALREAGLLEQVARCQAVEGIGFLTATALVMAYSRGDFNSSDSYIAFLGMDLRVTAPGVR
ncbi:IS110 family transposase, partial [Pseudomonas syringae]|uniref:IS110 family transposase n=1 Tax=Pseudomonas syringae TaxID=317 RepID=UPI000EFF0C80